MEVRPIYWIVHLHNKAGAMTQHGSSGDDRVARIVQLVEQHANLEGPLLPVLHAVQDEFGCVDREAVATIADAMNLSRAEVHGVVSFYHLFRETPPGRKTLYICRAEACQSMGGNQLIEHARARLGIDFHETTADGSVTLEPIYCLGNCACAPAVMVDDTLHGRVTNARLDDLVDS